MANDDVELASVTIHRSLTRPLLMSGGEREPMLILWLTVVALVFVGLSLVSLIAGIVLALTVAPVLRRLAKADPAMFGVYKRHISYGGRKLARATPWGQTRRSHGWGL